MRRDTDNVSRLWNGWALPVLVSIISSAVMTTTLKSGTAFIDSINGYHLHPDWYWARLMHAWDTHMYLGYDNGGAQLVLFPGALAYALMHHWGIGSAEAQRVYFFVLFLAISLSITWFTKVVAARMTALQPVVFVAPIFYLCNLYVAINLPTASAMLWPYATLPLIMGLAYLGIQSRRAVRYGLLIGLASLFVTGVNAALISINCVVTLAFIGIVIAMDENRREAWSAAGRLLVVGLFASACVNAYWLWPFLYHTKTAWLASVFSENILQHSAAANVPDILRLLGDPGFFGHDKIYGWYFAFAPYYVGVGLSALATFAVPLVAFGVFFYKAAFKEPLVRFFGIVAIAIVPLASGAHLGADGGVWTGRIFAYLSDHFLLFQIFRGVEKWDSVIAFAYAMLCAYHAGALAQAARLVSNRLAVAGVVPVALLPFVVILPLVTYGVFRSDDVFHSGVPSYWQQARGDLDLDHRERVALFPEQYLPHYFWGDVGTDYASLALEHPTAYSTAHGSGSPSEATDFMLEAMYGTTSLAQPVSLPLFQRLAISDVMEEADSYYADNDTGASPRIQLASLRSLPGVHEWKTVGALTDFRVDAPEPMMSLARPFTVSSVGTPLLNVLRLLRPDETAISNESNGLGNRLPGIINADQSESLAVETTKGLASTRSSGGAFRFWLNDDTNVRVFIRRAPTTPDTVNARFIMDSLQANAQLSYDWSPLAATRLVTGRHEISVQGSSPSSGFDIKVVDDDVFQQALQTIATDPHNLRMLTISSASQQVSVPAAGRYVLRSISQAGMVANFTFPLSFSPYANYGGSWCGEIPVIPSGRGIVENDAPPREWFFDPQRLPYASRGRVASTWYASDVTLSVFNPFSSSKPVRIAGIMAAVGAPRTVAMLDPHGMPIGQPQKLDVPALYELPNLQRTVLGSQYLGLAPHVVSAAYAVTLPPKWSLLTLRPSRGEGLPNVSEPLNGFVTFGTLGDLRATACGVSQPNRVRRNDALPRVVVENKTPDTAASALATLRVPGVDFGSLPVLTITAQHSGTISLLAIVHYHNGNVAGIYTVPFSGVGGDDEQATLLPGDSSNKRGIITQVDVIATLLSGQDVALSEPRLTLRRGYVVRDRSLPLSGDLNFGGTTHITVPPVSNLLRKSLVLELNNTNPGLRDITIETDRRDTYLGRAVRLIDPEIERLSDVYAVVRFKMPLQLPASELDYWRGHVRLFANGREFARARTASPLPDQYTIDGTEIKAVVGIEQAAKLRHWTLLYVPADWVTESRYHGETEELTLPLVNALTTLDGREQPLSHQLQVHAVSQPGQSGTYDAPISLDETFIQEVMPGKNGEEVPNIVVDGRKAAPHSTIYGWFESTLNLSGGVHTFGSRGREHYSSLLLPANEASGVASAPSDWTSADDSSARFDIGSRRTTGAVVFRQMYSPGWIGRVRQHQLPHVIADGYANAFLLDGQSGEVNVYYWPETALWASRIISVAALAFCGIGVLLSICLQALGRRHVYSVS